MLGNHNQYELPFPGDPFTGGVLDEIQYFNRALSAAEITAIKQQSKPNPTPSQTPIASWKGENTADGGNNQFVGVLSGTVGYAAGKVGNGFLFGQNGYIKIPHDDRIGFDGDFSFAFWMKSDPIGPGTYWIASKQHQSSLAAPFGIGIDNRGTDSPFTRYTPFSSLDSALVFTIGGGGNCVMAPPYSGCIQNTVAINNAVAPNTFHHVVASMKGNEMRLHFDCQLRASTQFAGRRIPSGPSLMLGAFQFYEAPFTQTPTYFHGILDEIQYFNRALSDTEVQSFCNPPQPATISFGNLTQLYDGTPKSPTVTTVPPGLNVVLQGVPQTNAGSYPVSATISDPNYTGSASATFIIQPAPATVTLSNLTQVHDGTAKSPTVSTSPSGLSYSLVGAPQTNIGNYPVTATINNPNYTGTASGDFVIVSPGTVVVRLVNSSGNGIAGGVVEYFSAGWKPFGTTNAAGQASSVLAPGTYSFAINYGGMRIQLSQNTATSPVVTFQTRAVQVRLRNSQNNPLDTGTVQYFASGWKQFGTGTTSGGLASMELLPATYPFSMTYGGQLNQISQDISSNPVITFQTRAIQVRLRNSQGNPLDTGTVQYFASGWKPFGAGTTSGGVASMELLPATYPFSMTYSGQLVQISQDVLLNPVVSFQTVAVQVRLRNSLNNPLDTGTVQYFASGWKQFGAGTTSGGLASMELFPAIYSFSMTYGGQRNQTSQDTAQNPVVTFQTSAVQVWLRDSQNSPLDTGTVQYFASGWKPFGTGATSGGVTTMELLPANYSFSMTYGGQPNQLSQDTSVNPVVTFQTKAVQVWLRDSQNNPLDTGLVEYFASGWKPFGTGSTSGGRATMELLPANYAFAMNYAGARVQANQDISLNPSTTFQTGAVDSLSNTAIEYFASGWRTFVEPMQLLPGSYLFRFSDGSPNTSFTIQSGSLNQIR